MSLCRDGDMYVERKSLSGQETVDELLELASSIDYDYFFQRIYDMVLEAQP